MAAQKKGWFLGHIKSLAKNSEFLRRPGEKVLGNSTQRLLFWLVNLITVLLFFPFTWRSMILEACVLIVTIGLYHRFTKRKKIWVRSLCWWVVALLMLCIAAICPFITVPKPVYIAVSGSPNPAASQVLILKIDQKSIGSVFIVSSTDFIRKKIALFAEDISPASFRVLRKESFGDSRYYYLPIIKSFTIDSKERGQVTWKRSIYFPYSVLYRAVDVNLVNDHPLSGQTKHGDASYTAFGTTGGSLFDTAYTQYLDTVPWDAVQVWEGREDNSLSYVALLDRTLEYLATGKTAEALRTLEEAANEVPESNLEAARLATLQYLVVQRSLGGNIGALQSVLLC